MACKIFISEDSDEEVGDGTRQVDIISQLERVPHAIKEIFLHFDIAMVFEAVNVSTTWKRLITSLNILQCVWQEKLNTSSTWRILSARMEHLQPQLWDRMKKGDVSSYKEACRYVEANIRQISQSPIQNFNFLSLLNEDFPPVIRMNDKYLFIGGKSKVEIFNRWTRQLVKDLACPGRVCNMQLNERFLVVQLHSRNGDQIDVYDVQKLEYIQTLETNRNSFKIKFSLGSDFLFICGESIQFEHFIHVYCVHRWNPSEAQFVRETETEGRLKVDFVHDSYMFIYVDDKYLVVDFIIRAENLRLVKVFSLETMQLVRERKFHDNNGENFLNLNFIRNEYHDGGIVVRTCADGQPSCVALWDVDKDTVRPIAGHPSKFDYSLTMTRHPFQIAVEKRENQLQLLLVQRGQPTRNSVIDMPSQFCVNTQHYFFPPSFYFDGVQLIAYCFSHGRWGIMIADLVG